MKQILKVYFITVNEILLHIATAVILIFSLLFVWSKRFRQRLEIAINNIDY